MKKVIITLYKLKQDKQRILGVQEYLLEKDKKKTKKNKFNYFQV